MWSQGAEQSECGLLDSQLGESMNELWGHKEEEMNESKKVTAEANVEGRKGYLKKQ